MKKIKSLLICVMTAFCLAGWVGFTLAALNGRSDNAEPDSSMTVDETETVADAETYDDNEVVLYY